MVTSQLPGFFVVFFFLAASLKMFGLLAQYNPTNGAPAKKKKRTEEAPKILQAASALLAILNEHHAPEATQLSVVGGSSFCSRDPEVP